MGVAIAAIGDITFKRGDLLANPRESAEPFPGDNGSQKLKLDAVSLSPLNIKPI